MNNREKILCGCNSLCDSINKINKYIQKTIFGNKFRCDICGKNHPSHFLLSNHIKMAHREIFSFGPSKTITLDQLTHPARVTYLTQVTQRGPYHSTQPTQPTQPTNQSNPTHPTQSIYYDVIDIDPNPDNCTILMDQVDLHY